MVLLKLGKQEEHMEMFRRGMLCMNTLSYFQKLESDRVRGDKFEGTTRIMQPSEIAEFVLDPRIEGVEPIKLHGGANASLTAPLRLSLNRTLACNVFCMFAINSPVVPPIFANDLHESYECFVVITNTQEFLTRVSKAATREQLCMESRTVEYYDENKYTGETGVFRKPSSHRYQSEYRIVVRPGGTERRFLAVGDLSDITSDVIGLAKADEVLKFGQEEAREAGLIWDAP